MGLSPPRPSLHFCSLIFFPSFPYFPLFSTQTSM